MASEAELQQKIRLLSKGDVRLFRNNVGLAWVGDSVVKLKNGDVLLKNGRPFKAGVEGMSDLAGWKSVVITQDMVGHRFARYLALEVKTPGHRTQKDRLEKQLAFIATVQQHGGIAGMVESEEQAKELLK
jgi:hypothetical protein